MRKVGSDLTESQARKFVDYMFTQGISCQAEPVGAEDSPYFDIWVRDEDQLEPARETLARFRDNPDDAQFDVSEQAAVIRREQEKQQRERLRLQQAYQSRGAGNRGGFAFASAPARWTVGIIVTCVAVSLVTNFGYLRDRSGIESMSDLPTSFRIYNALTLVPAVETGPPKSPLGYVAQGQVWRLVTPIFLHASPMHLLFNCLFIFFFGRVIEQIWGARYLVVLFLLGGVVGNLTQAYGPAMLGASPNVVGASGGALGLFTFLWLRPMIDPSVPIRIPVINVVFILGFVVLGMLNSSMMPGVAHLAHIGGMVAGAAAALGVLDFLHR